MSTKMLAPIAGFALALGLAGSASATTVSYDFRIDGGSLQTVGSAPYGLTSGDFPIFGSFSGELGSTTNGFLAITPLTFTLDIGPKTFVLDDVSRAFANSATLTIITGTYPNDYGVINIPTARYAFGSFYLFNDTDVASGTSGNSVTCYYCVTVLKSTGPSPLTPLPIPSSLPLMGLGLLVIGAYGARVKMTKS